MAQIGGAFTEKCTGGENDFRVAEQWNRFRVTNDDNYVVDITVVKKMIGACKSKKRSADDVDMS